MKNRRTVGGVIKENKMLLTTFLLLSGVAAASYLYLVPATYTSTAVLRTQDPAAAAEINSSTFLASAFEEQALTVGIMQYADLKTTPVKAPFNVEYRILSAKLYRQLFTVDCLPEDSYQITSTQFGVTRTYNVKAGAETVIGNIGVTIKPVLGVTPTDHSMVTGTQYLVTLQSPQSIANQLKTEGTLNITPGEGTVQLTITENDPRRAQALLASIVSSYTGTSTITSTAALSTAYDDRLQELSERLSATETNINEYKRLNNITDIESDIRSEQEYGNLLKQEKAELEIQMVALGNLHTYLRQNMDRNNSGVEYDVITDPAFAQDLSKINDKYIQLAAVGMDASASDAETMALKENISERILNTRRKVAVKIDQMEVMIAKHQARMSTFPQQSGELLALNRQLALDQKVYDLMVTRRAETLVNGNQNTVRGNAVIEAATFPMQPTAPILWQVISLFMAAGMTLGMMLAYSRSRRISDIIHNRPEAEAVATGMRYIGSVGTLTGMNAAADSAFSNLSTRFLMHGNAKMVTVTSSLKGEGKTFIARNFAKSLASLDKKVLLIDMNLYHAQIAESFDVQYERTLADVLDKRCDIHDAIYITSIPNLEIATAGSLRGGVNSILVSKESDKIFDKLKSHYDAIIIDTPEAGKYIDAIPMMRMSDLNFYVVRANGTSKTQLANAEVIGRDFGINNLHLVLNTIEKGVNHSGIKAKGTYRKLHSNDSPNIANRHIPEVLRKIALWFY